MHQVHQTHQTQVVFAAREDGDALLVFCAILFFIGRAGEVRRGGKGSAEKRGGGMKERQN